VNTEHCLLSFSLPRSRPQGTALVLASWSWALATGSGSRLNSISISIFGFSFGLDAGDEGNKRPGQLGNTLFFERSVTARGSRFYTGGTQCCTTPPYSGRANFKNNGLQWGTQREKQ